MMTYDNSRSQLAYADAAMPKLRYELSCEDLVTRQRALNSMSDLIKSSERVYEAVETGCLKQLVHLMNDTNDSVRLKSSEVVHNICQHTIGRRAFMALPESLPNVTSSFNDDSFKIRVTAFRIVNELCTIQPLAQQVDQGKEMTKLIVREQLSKVRDSLSDDREDRDELDCALESLRILQKLLFADSPILDFLGTHKKNKTTTDDDEGDFVSSEILLVFKGLLGHENIAVRTETCKALHDLCCNNYVAKSAASQDEALLERLVKYISCSHPVLQAASSMALMTICITTAGKVTAVKYDICNRLDHLLDQILKVSVSRDDCHLLEYDSLRLNAVRLVQVVSEVPEARKFFRRKEQVEKITKIENNVMLSSDIRRAASECKEVVLWQP